MNYSMIYLLKSSACLGLFYVVYLALFRNTDRFQLNRVYLLAGLILSFVLPLIVLPVTPIDVDIVPTFLSESNAPAQPVEHIQNNVTGFDVTSIVQFVYISGLMISMIISISTVFRMLRLYRSSEKFRHRGRTIAISPNRQSFSFFGFVFVGSIDEGEMIVGHELVHVRQYHWIDLVVAEIAAAVLWFNPLIYFYRKSIAIQHEYIADRTVVSKVPVKDYLNCIVQQLELNLRSAFISSFNTQSIKQRIIMMTNTRSYSPLRYGIVFPVIVLMMMAFADRERQNGEFRSPVDVSKLRKEPGPGFGARLNPATNKEQVHTGVDLITAAGNAVYATADGVVTKTSNTGNRGNFILITHDSKLASSYSHLEKINVKEGETVHQGQLIGLVGSSGLSTGPHLHFEVLKDGKAVDPVPYLNMK
jgi:murein DD-endopeptidase MepM/ murein hydrolase activator NlpD